MTESHISFKYKLKEFKRDNSKKRLLDEFKNYNITEDEFLNQIEQLVIIEFKKRNNIISKVNEYKKDNRSLPRFDRIKLNQYNKESKFNELDNILFKK